MNKKKGKSLEMEYYTAKKITQDKIRQSHNNKQKKPGKK